jgi:hypothetical protein
MIGDGDGKFAMVWECTSMGGYEVEAKEIWQAFIKNIRQRLVAVHLITPNIVIRSGAMVIGIFAGLRITTWASLDEFRAASGTAVHGEG